MFLIEQESKQGLPLGVSYNTNRTRYRARYRDAQGNRIHIGVYDTQEAAHVAWYSHKREVIQMILKEYTLSDRAVAALVKSWDL